MSNFPINFDDDTTLPIINNNLTEIGGEAINAVRDATFNIEQYLGLGGNGTTPSIAHRLGISLNPDGTIKASAIASLGLVTLPITNSQIASNAEIPESKLKLDYRTSDLFNYIRDLSNGVNTSLSWISATGIKIEPHLLGAIYRHTLDQIDVSNTTSLYFKNKFRTFRNNTNAYTAINDLNNEVLEHQFADGSYSLIPNLIVTNNGSTYPSTHAHVSSGIYLNTSKFATIPQTTTDLQQFADYIDSASIFLLGTRIQNLYSNGISRESRSSNLTKDGYGQFIVPSTPAIAYLLGNGTGSNPVDDIDIGDDIIEFKPSSTDSSSNSFDAKFALVKIGDIIRVNYGGIEISHIVKEKKYIQTTGNKKYIIRIEGKNYKYTTTASARIDKPLFNNNKYGALSLSAVNNNFSGMPSLIIGSPRGAMALGVGFNPDLLDNEHYLLYLAIYPTGRIEDGYTVLPGIDVTGNLGSTPGKYTLSSVVETTNEAFRKSGFNYRFAAFQHQGEFGIALADSYKNASFSIFSGIVASNGTYDSIGTSITFPNNVVGIFPKYSTLTPPDPLGFGPYKSNFASPPYMSTYGSAEASQNPTKLFVPLKRNNFYVNGIEIEKFGVKTGQVLDGYGDGYWQATIIQKNIIPGPSPTGRVQTTYRIDQDLFNTNLAVGKTIVVQPLNSNGIVNYGRFIIESIGISCTSNVWTDITVYDAVHGVGTSPSSTFNVGTKVAIYFSDDSVSFNEESATDFNSFTNRFKRHFEVYINEKTNTFTHERARINATGVNLTINSVTLYSDSELSKLNILKVSPKLRGYQFGSVNKISLRILNFYSSGAFDGYLCYYDGTNCTKLGPLTIGKIGQVTKFYDETNIDYIDLIFNAEENISAFTNRIIDFQLFPTLSLDNEIMLLGTCQLNDITNNISFLRDERQFGNISEKDLSTSALNYISIGEKLLHANGVIRGFDLENKDSNPNPSQNQIFMTGGLALVNGKFVQVNNQTVSIPIIKEKYSSTLYNVNWALCINDKGEYQPIPLLDYDQYLTTPNNSDRTFNAINPVNAVEYKLESSTFSNIINNRKDLVLLYIVSSTVTPPVFPSPIAISLTLQDVRRYTNDVDNNLSLKLTSSNSQGNFKNPIAILNWLKYNNNFNGTAIVKGATATTGVINTPLILKFASQVTIDGQNDAELTINQPVVLGSNLTLKNLKINFNNGVSVTSNTQNLIFENCQIYVNNSLTISAPINNTIFDFNTATGIKITDCTFNINYPIQSSSGAVFRLQDTDSFIIDNSSMSVNFNFESSTQVPGDFFIVKNSDGFTINNSTFSGNFSQFIRNTNSQNMSLKGLSISCSFNINSFNVYDSTTDPLGYADGLSSLNYSSSNLVNSGRASLLYSKVTESLDNIIIDNISYFNSSTGSDRLSLINFELSSNTSVLSNVLIKNSKFYTNVTVEDYRPIVAIVNTAPYVVKNQLQPLLKNVVIENNYCNRNQSIIFTSKLNESSLMNYPGLVTQNCVIKNNTCGTIGYWVTSSSKTVNISPNINNFSDKDSSLLIDNNNCHLIHSCDSTGAYFLVSKKVSGDTINMCAYPSGNVIISNNICNWIQTGISYEENSFLKIVHNTLTAYDNAYLDIFGNTDAFNIAAGIDFSNKYAIFVSSNKLIQTSIADPGEGNNSSCIISDNITSAGYWLQGLNSKIKYTYGGYIRCLSSNIISNNILKGVAGFFPWSYGLKALDLIIISGAYNLITNNKIYRNNSDVNSYIRYFSNTVPPVSDFKSYGLIVDNIFDSIYTSDSLAADSEYLAEQLVDNIQANWTVERNKNQTKYISVPILNESYSWGVFGVSTLGKQYPNDYLWATSAPAKNGVITYKSPIFWIHDWYNATYNPIDTRLFGWQMDLTKIVPNNVKIIKAQLGVRSFNSLMTNDSYVKLFINKWSPGFPNDVTNLDYFTSQGGLADLTNPPATSRTDSRLIEDASSSTPYAEITGSQFNATLNTIVKTIDLTKIDTSTGGSGSTDVTENYIIGKSYSISLSLSVSFKLHDNLSLVDLYFSPILIKYRW